MNKKDVDAINAEAGKVARGFSKSDSQTLTLRQAQGIARRMAYQAELEAAAEFFGRWLNVLNLTPVMDKLDAAREARRK